MNESRGFSAMGGMRHPAHRAASPSNSPYLAPGQERFEPVLRQTDRAGGWSSAHTPAQRYGADDYADPPLSEAHYSEAFYSEPQYSEPLYSENRYQEPRMQRAAPARFAAVQAPASGAGLRAEPRLAAQPRHAASPPPRHMSEPDYPAQQAAYRDPYSESYASPYPGQYPDEYPDHFAARYPGQGAAQAQPKAQPRPRLSVNALMQSAGALLSVALILGSGAWIWQMMQRDVAGVPVVRALEGPLRVAPEIPGGRQAEHQGLAVTQLAGSQEAAVPSDIVLAPPAPELQLDDVPAPFVDAPQFAGGPQEGQPILAALQQAIDMPGFPADPLGINNPTARAVAASPRPAPRRGSPGPQLAAAPAIAAPGALALDDLAASVASSVALGLSGTQDIDIDPATIGPGTRLVQLGAYDDAASARQAWDQLRQRFSPLLDDRGRVIEAAHSGGSVFYRLRAHGFSDERDARRFCAALVDQQIDCIPVLIR
jgi:hypothetical protein